MTANTLEPTTSSIVLSSQRGTNADLFPSILSIYAKRGDAILDMTYGKGVFWQKVDMNLYLVTTNDRYVDGAALSHDFRSMPLDSERFDMVILDPPYMYNPKGTIKKSISATYNLNGSEDIRTNADVMRLYTNGIKEARRLLKPGGILIVKVKDTIESGKQRWNHVDVMKSLGFYCEDLFVLTQNSTPAIDPKWGEQKHARKNHSFFVVLRKLGERSKRPSICSLRGTGDCTKEGCKGVEECPECGTNTHDDVTIGDHGMCRDCFEARE